jgi:hypothetical protein
MESPGLQAGEQLLEKADKMLDESERRFIAAMKAFRRTDGVFRSRAISEETGVPEASVRRKIKALLPFLDKFETPALPHRTRQIDELIQDKLKESERVIAADEARELIPVKINIDGPFGLLVFGDPHVDDPGCDFALLKSHIELAQKHDHILAGNIGDLANNWVGRLARLYADQSVTAREGWTLVEWMVKSVNWLFIIAGNHDCWTGSGDPVAWFSKQSGSMYEEHGVRLELHHPGSGIKTRIHARHDFPGHSIWNNMHGPKRELVAGFRDHILIAGHRHIGGDEGTVSPDGTCAQLVRVSGYKRADAYARQLGLKKMPIHPAALIIIDPREPETSRARAWCAPTVELGVKLLNEIRREYEAGGQRIPGPVRGRK